MRKHLLRLSSSPLVATRITTTHRMSLYPVLGSLNFLTSAFVKLCLISHFVLRLFVCLVFRVCVSSACLYDMSNFWTFSIGVAKNYIQNVLDMKKSLSIIILDKLHESLVATIFKWLNLGTACRKKLLVQINHPSQGNKSLLPGK